MSVMVEDSTRMQNGGVELAPTAPVVDEAATAPLVDSKAVEGRDGAGVREPPTGVRKEDLRSALAAAPDDGAKKKILVGVIESMDKDGDGVIDKQEILEFARAYAGHRTASSAARTSPATTSASPRASSATTTIWRRRAASSRRTTWPRRSSPSARPATSWRTP